MKTGINRHSSPTKSTFIVILPIGSDQTQSDSALTIKECSEWESLAALRTEDIYQRPGCTASSGA